MTFPGLLNFGPPKIPIWTPWGGVGFLKKKYCFSGQFMTFPGLLNFWPPKIPPGTPLGSGGSIFFRFESVPYPSEYVCQIWLRSDRRACNAGMTIAKCTKTVASSNVSNHLSRTPAAWCASGAAHHARPYRNLGRRISLRSYTIVATSLYMCWGKNCRCFKKIKKYWVHKHYGDF